jgi:hypothetical protein
MSTYQTTPVTSAVAAAAGIKPPTTIDFITRQPIYDPPPSSGPTYTDASGRIVNVPMPSTDGSVSSRFSPFLVTQFASDPSNTVGQLTRAQWADYVSRYSPIENRLMNMTTYNSPELVSQEVGSATAAAGTALDVAAGNRSLSRAQFGLTARTGQQQLEGRQINLAKSTAMVDAANRTRQVLADRNRMIAVGSVPHAGRPYGLSTEG